MESEEESVGCFLDNFQDVESWRLFWFSLEATGVRIHPSSRFHSRLPPLVAT
jgi:hypothetical protein